MSRTPYVDLIAAGVPDGKPSAAFVIDADEPLPEPWARDPGWAIVCGWALHIRPPGYPGGPTPAARAAQALAVLLGARTKDPGARRPFYADGICPSCRHPSAWLSTTRWGCRHCGATGSLADLAQRTTGGLLTWVGDREAPPGPPTVDGQGQAVRPEEGEQFVSPHIKISRGETNNEVSSCPLPFTPLSQLLAATPAEPDWLWRGFLAPGCISLLAGRPKVGKSSLVFALLRALGAGEPLLGHSTRPARVVLLTEERPATLVEKAGRWAVGDHVTVLLRQQALHTPWPEVLRQAAEHAAGIGAEVLVVDTFPEWAGLAGDAENLAGCILEAMRPVQEAAARGLAVLLVAHQRKAPGALGEAVRGSSALVGAVDILLELERPGEDSLPPTARVLRGASRFEATPAEIVLSLTGEGYQALGSLQEVEAETQRRAVLEALVMAGAATADQVAEATGLPRATAHKRLGELLARGQVTRSGAGRRGDPHVWRPAQEFVSPQQNYICGETNLNGNTAPPADEGTVSASRPDPPAAGLADGRAATSGSSSNAGPPKPAPPVRCTRCRGPAEAAPAPGYPGWVKVRCRACGHTAYQRAAPEVRPIFGAGAGAAREPTPDPPPGDTDSWVEEGF